MEFVFETVYDKKALTAFTKTIRKTTRKKKSRIIRALAWVVVALSLLRSVLSAGEEFAVGIPEILTGIALLLMLIVSVWGDSIDGYFAQKRILPGLRKITATFNRDGYETVTAIETGSWRYDGIQLIAETDNYFVFLFGPRTGQVYDKAGLSGGTAEEFSAFIEEMTGIKVKKIK